MTLYQLNEMPSFKEGDRIHTAPHPELCKKIDLASIKNKQHIQMANGYEALVFNNTVYCFDLDGTIVSILEAPRTDLIKPYFKGIVAHEESIDTCERYRGKKITTEFYYAILKSRTSILSDYEHYSGTKRLWKSLSKKKDVIIKIFKDHELLSDDYDLILDELDVWSSNRFLIFATTKKIIEMLESRIPLIDVE